MCPPLDVSGPACPLDPAQVQGESRIAIGRRAEGLAAAYLELLGYRVLHRNLREGPREIDLIAAHDGWLIAVEVRFRSNTNRGLPEETVHRYKRRNLLRAGQTWWTRHHEGRGPLRFDLVSVFLNSQGLTLRHYSHFMRPMRSP
jgi:putative endonuclease